MERGYYNTALFLVAEKLKRFEERNGAILTEQEVDERGADYLRQFLKTNKTGETMTAQKRNRANHNVKITIK